ncbi:putative ABC transport system permease protein [Rhizobium sp. RU35A]|uniref:ABC transporter permease n=1 Tax=Rhizobium sp. RU35A TaxID=1907414 RepID=UPI000953F2FD|nr:ABC transporter permease [Rhizobium sp. RU35A]SIR08432.1 putative ABC transport system permease protein [Rhizobium sp. RU35A]
MISFVLADLRRLWLGAFVLVLLVALATALGVAVTVQERALRLGSARAADRFDLVVGAAGSETQLVLSSVFLQPSPLPLMPGAVLAKLAADPRVAWAAPVGFGDSFMGYPIIGTTTALVKGTTAGFAEGGLFVHEGEAIVGAAVHLPLGAEIKPMHGTAETGGETHTEIAYRVVGRVKPTGTPWDRAILVPVQAVWHIHGLGHDDHGDHDDDHHAGGEDGDHAADAAHLPAHADGAVAGHDEAGHDADHHEAGEHGADDHDEHDHDGDGHHHGHIDPDGALNEAFTDQAPGLPAILVKPKTIADAYRLRQEYRTAGTLAVFPGEVLTRLYGTLGDAKMVLSAVAAGSQALVAAALLLVSVIHVTQRRRQIGALRAFGAPRLAVFGIVWSELFVLVLIGIALGFGGGYLAARLIGDAFTRQTGVILPVEFAAEDGGMALILLAIGMVFAAIPALMAYRQSPAQALRS